jgi:hypothetical protein
MSLDRRVLNVVSPERTFTGIGAHYCVTSAIMSFEMRLDIGRRRGAHSEYPKAGGNNRVLSDDKSARTRYVGVDGQRLIGDEM